MSDLIRIVDLEAWAKLGVTEEERTEPQLLLVSLELRVHSFSEAARTDDIEGTVNYFDVAERVKEVAAETSVRLLETLAEKIARDLLEKFSMVSLKLEIKKFVLPEARWVSVEIERN